MKRLYWYVRSALWARHEHRFVRDLRRYAYEDAVTYVHADDQSVAGWVIVPASFYQKVLRCHIPGEPKGHHHVEGATSKLRWLKP